MWHDKTVVFFFQNFFQWSLIKKPNENAPAQEHIFKSADRIRKKNERRTLWKSLMSELYQCSPMPSTRTVMIKINSWKRWAASFSYYADLNCLSFHWFVGLLVNHRRVLGIKFLQAAAYGACKGIEIVSASGHHWWPRRNWINRKVHIFISWDDINCVSQWSEYLILNSTTIHSNDFGNRWSSKRINDCKFWDHVYALTSLSYCPVFLLNMIQSFG